MKRKQRKQRKPAKKKSNNSYKEKSAHENEEFKETFKINQALSSHNYALLREIGRETGFLSDGIRRRVWPYLLHCVDPELDNIAEGSLEVPHKDEEQVKLDVVRSFNSYPKNVTPDDKRKLEDQLSRVITHVLRSYPSLHYFQGFHDICSVFILLFGEKYACKMMEPVSLFYLRDGMYVTMEPVLRELTILDTLIRLEDTELHGFISEAGVLPYYCLSWVITWCSHDLDDMSMISRLFDLFLCSNPFMPIYFSAAVVMSRKDQVLELECDVSIIHSFLTKLPNDLDVETIIQKACKLEEKYSAFELQCESLVALDKVSAINRFEQDWVSIHSREELEDVLRDTIIPILQDKEERQPIELLTIVKGKKKKRQQQSKSLLQRLRQVDKKDMALYTLVTIGAGVGLLAVFISNADMMREWLITSV